MKPFELPLQAGETSRLAAASRWRSDAKNARGFATLSALGVLLMTLTLGSAALLFTLLDVKATQHYNTGNQAFAAAEAGVLDVINTIGTRGVVNFQNDIVNAGIVSTALTALPGYPNVTYQVTGLVSGTNPATDGVLTVTGNAPLSAQRVLTLRLTRGGFGFGPGALHLSNDAAVGTLSGTSFNIDGNNWAVDPATQIASLDPSVPARPGISTRNDAVTTALASGLTYNQKENVLGLGYSDSPLTPSVETTAAASTADMLRMVNDILAANGAPNGCPSGNGSPMVGQVQCIGKANVGSGGSGATLGTAAAPQITELTNSDAKIAGGSTGYGILIVDANVAFNGNFTFYGWVLFRNPSSTGITVGGTVSLYGSVWSPLPSFSGNGNISIDYCQMCLAQYADGAGGNGAGNLPHSVVISSWSD